MTIEEFNNTYKVTYESSDENILKIKDNKVSAVGVGKATIYAKSKNSHLCVVGVCC